MPFAKPPFSRINWANPLTRGLQFLVAPDSMEVFDLVKDRPQNLNQGSGNLSQVFTQHGLAFGGNDGEQFSNASTTDLHFSGQFSTWCVTYIGTVNSDTTDFANVFMRYNYASETSNQGWGFQKVPTTYAVDGTPRISFLIANNNSNYPLQDTSLALAARQVNHYVGVRDVTTRRLYRDGVQRVTSTNITLANNTTTGVVMGGNNATNNFYILLGGVWNRALSAGEVASLYADPLQVLTSPQSPYAAAFPIASPVTPSQTKAKVVGY